MNTTLTTQEAQDLAVSLAQKGMSYRKIGKHLARNGYISFRTGKPVTAGGINAMLIRAKKGIPASNRNFTKHAGKAFRYLPRDTTKRTVVPSAAAQVAATTMVTTSRTMTLAQAVVEITNMANRHGTIAEALGVLLHNVK